MIHVKQNKHRFTFSMMFICLISMVFSISALSHTKPAHTKPSHAKSSTTTSPPKKLLFVGNSFSFYNNGIHNHLGSLLRANGEWQRGENRHKLLTYSGGHIFEQIISIAGIFKVDTRGFDAVILQGHSNEAISKNKKERFEAGLQRATTLIKKQNLEPILFMTWGYANDKEMAEKVATAYVKQGKKLGVRVAPVGIAFAQASELYPEIALYVPDVLGAKNGSITYQKDLKHPSVAGTYLAACVFYSLLFDKSPEGNLFKSSLSAKDALALQRLSWQVVTSFTQANKV